jgi:hypothetical protein
MKTKKSIFDDRALMLYMVRKHSWALQYVSKRLRNDKDFMRAVYGLKAEENQND